MREFREAANTGPDFECRAAKIGLAGTAALDLLFVTGAGAAATYGVKAWRAGRAAASSLNRTRAVLMVYNAEQARNAATARAASVITARREAFGAAWAGGSTLATGGNLGWGILLDMTLGVGTYRAYQVMKTECGQ